MIQKLRATFSWFPEINTKLQARCKIRSTPINRVDERLGVAGDDFYE
jgi:hypothetical protein